MAASVIPITELELPPIPISDIQEFIPYFAQETNRSVAETLAPFKAYEKSLRKIYAQQPAHSAIRDGRNPNLVPVFAGHETKLRIRARNLAAESVKDKETFLMPLPDEERKKDGEPAIVQTIKVFQKNFNLFSESSLAELDWSNVVAAGSAITTSLLPVPEKWAESKKSLREYYHQRLAPASDVDLFLYDLTEEAAVEKIKQIERAIKDSILQETTTIRTKNAITIASEYPTRHVQIVLRLYDSIPQIISGFDVDCACVAYDGKQVYASPRALAAFSTQCNTVDLSRRSPSYENRLSKYSHRGFEVHWDQLNRSLVDPTIYDRSFQRTMGLARLLVLEKLPKSVDRDEYADLRRKERGRPPVNRSFRNQHRLWGNIKEMEEDDVPDWQLDDQGVSNYHSMVIPYGQKFNAAKINRLLYSKDLLLNAEWNKPKDREVNLHRHPCFFGDAEDVITDCCGFCPEPVTEEEQEVAMDENKIYIKGPISFIKDDPGRQETGSFNPITTDDWTEMAYVGQTQMLMQAIIDKDIEYIESWCKQEGNNVNTRDYVGRTPLHLAVTSSSIEVIQLLIDYDARLVARLIDGRTSLHLASQLGRVDVIKAIMLRSSKNSEAQEEKEEAKRVSRKEGQSTVDECENEESSGSEKFETESSETYDNDDPMTEGSFVKLSNKPKAADALEENEEEPDILGIDVVAWDSGATALHYAIIGGHLETIRMLVTEYGADALLPVKIANTTQYAQNEAILSLVLPTLVLPEDTCKEVVRLLLELGTSSAQADMKFRTAPHFLAANGSDLLDVLFAEDGPAVRSVLNNVAVAVWPKDGETILKTAIKNGQLATVKSLLKHGAKPQISSEDWLKGYLMGNEYAKNNTTAQNLVTFQSSVVQPIIEAAKGEHPLIVKILIEAGADPSTMDSDTIDQVQAPNSWRYQWKGRTILDHVREKLKNLKDYLKDYPLLPNNGQEDQLKEDAFYLAGSVAGSFEHFVAQRSLEAQKRKRAKSLKEKSAEAERQKNETGSSEKLAAIIELISDYEAAEESILGAGGKTFESLYPDLKEIASSRDIHAQMSVKPYETSYEINLPDMTDDKLAAYKRLFEAAWDNDVETVKNLTLERWTNTQDGSSKPPLQVAVQQGSSYQIQQSSYTYTQHEWAFSPFSVAVLRGHYALATTIVDIAQAQYQPPEESIHQKRWLLNAGTTDSDEESESDDGESPQIYSQLVSNTFTIHDITAVSGVVRSKVLPMEMVEWNCNFDQFQKSDEFCTSKSKNLMNYAIDSDDMKMFKFLLQIGMDQAKFFAVDDDDARFYNVNMEHFNTALALGRTAMLAELIKTCGTGIPFDKLVEKSGVEAKKTSPRFYQGLSIAGKKRTDWAQAGRPQEAMKNFTGSNVSPLFAAADAGSIESVEWFSSDTPARLYNSFKEAHLGDKRIKILQQTKGGFEGTIQKWMSTNSLLTLHAAICWSHRGENGIEQGGLHNLADIEKQTQLVKHVINLMPEALNCKSIQGYTPLAVAAIAFNEQIVSLLLKAGADARARDTKLRNIVHLLVVALPNENHKAGDQLACSNASELKKILDHFEPKHVREMLVERCSVPGQVTATPLSHWLSHTHNRNHNLETLKVILSYGNGKELSMSNGAGDLPLHTAVRQVCPSIVKHLISVDPTMLFRENAVGITPFELARDLWLQTVVGHGVRISSSYYDHADITAKAPSEFVREEKRNSQNSVEHQVFEVCQEAAGKVLSKRELVTLFEANEVAKRLANANAEKKRNSQLGHKEEVADEIDEVEVRLPNSMLKRSTDNTFGDVMESRTL